MAVFEGNFLAEVKKLNTNVFVVTGRISRNGSDGSINFKSGLNAEADTILSIKLNKASKEFEFTSHKYGGNCDRPGKGLFKLKADSFKFYVMVCDDKIDIALDDVHLCTYEPTLPVVRIKSIMIDGVFSEINRVDHRRVYPTPFPTDLENARNLCFSADVPRHFQPGDKISITIIPKENFSLSLGNCQESFITVAGKTDGVIETSSPNKNLTTAATWKKNRPLKVNFEVQSTSIMISFDDETLATKLDINENFENLFKVRAESESLEIIQVIYN